MIDPEECTTTVNHLPMHATVADGVSDEWTRSRADAIAVYALVHRHRARAVARGLAVAAASLALAVAYARGSAGLALAALAACPVAYGTARWFAERRLCTRLGVPRATVSSCVAHYLASSAGAANADRLVRGDAQVRLHGVRDRTP